MNRVEDGIRVERAHPRERGEHAFGWGTVLFAVGSSPRARGAFCGNGGEADGVGLIPASAGSIYSPARKQRSPRAHPRERGEHALRSPGL